MRSVICLGALSFVPAASVVVQLDRDKPNEGNRFTDASWINSSDPDFLEIRLIARYGSSALKMSIYRDLDGKIIDEWDMEEDDPTQEGNNYYFSRVLDKEDRSYDRGDYRRRLIANDFTPGSYYRVTVWDEHETEFHFQENHWEPRTTEFLFRIEPDGWGKTKDFFGCGGRQHVARRDPRSYAAQYSRRRLSDDGELQTSKDNDQAVGASGGKTKKKDGTKTKAKGSNWMIWAAVIVLGLAIIGGAVYYFLFTNEEESEEDAVPEGMDMV